jgi:NitT/TauT family transport system ATP-binding protein
MSKIKIQINNVEKIFMSSKNETRLAVTEVNLDIHEGEFICLLGPSGCGKTTLLNLIAGFDKPSQGEITIDGARVEGTNPKFITIFQDYALFPWRNVLGNVEYGLEAKGINKEKRREISQEYIKLVGLEKFINSHPHELSGGMKQRVAIARALAVEPEILFMDEPFGALDAITRMNMQQEIIRICQESTKRTIIFVTHDIEEAIFLADRIVIMSPHPGRVKSVHSVELKRPRHRSSTDFIEIREKIYREFEL